MKTPAANPSFFFFLVTFVLWIRELKEMGKKMLHLSYPPHSPVHTRLAARPILLAPPAFSRTNAFLSQASLLLPQAR